MARPKGYSKLRGREKELKKYMDLGLNKTSISRLLGCSRGALYNYLRTMELKRGKA
jgi:DNA-binding CsgD family transcriptional regulator